MILFTLVLIPLAAAVALGWSLGSTIRQRRIEAAHWAALSAPRPQLYDWANDPEAGLL